MEAEPALLVARWIVGFLVFGLISSYMAYRKGYSPGWWFLGGGCLAWLIITCLPNTKTYGMPREQKVRLRKRGNLVGIILTSVVVILNFLLLVRAILVGE